MLVDRLVALRYHPNVENGKASKVMKPIVFAREEKDFSEFEKQAIALLQENYGSDLYDDDDYKKSKVSAQWISTNTTNSNDKIFALFLIKPSKDGASSEGKRNVEVFIRFMDGSPKYAGRINASKNFSLFIDRSENVNGMRTVIVLNGWDDEGWYVKYVFNGDEFQYLNMWDSFGREKSNKRIKSLGRVVI